MSSRSDRIESIILMLLGGGIIIYSFHLENNSGTFALAPGMFPTLIGSMLVLLAVLLLVRTYMQKESSSNPVQQNGPTITSQRYRQIFIVVACFAYILLMKYLSFVFASVLFLAGTSCLLGEKVWWKIGRLSILGAIVIFFSFQFGLKVYLP